MEHNDETVEPTRWGSSVLGTHQWISSRAFAILQNNKPSVYNWFMTSERSAAIEYSDWPDKSASNETGNGNNIHYYNYINKKNYYKNDPSKTPMASENAKTRFVYWYNQAVIAGRSANRVTAAQHLGKAIHYLSDIGSPPHVGDTYPGNAIAHAAQKVQHGNYELQAAALHNKYAVSTSPYYSWYINTAVSSIAETNAGVSYSYYDLAYTVFSPAGHEFPMKLVQQDIAGLLYKYFYDVTGRLS